MASNHRVRSPRTPGGSGRGSGSDYVISIVNEKLGRVTAEFDATLSRQLEPIKAQLSAIKAIGEENKSLSAEAGFIKERLIKLENTLPTKKELTSAVYKTWAFVFTSLIALAALIVGLLSWNSGRVDSARARVSESKLDVVEGRGSDLTEVPAETSVKLDKVVKEENPPS